MHITGKIDLDASVYYDFDSEQFRAMETDDYIALYFDSARILGFSGELVILAAWDGMAEHADEWEPQPYAQYVWQADTDEGTDYFYKDNVLIGTYFNSRGFIEVTRESDGQVWHSNGRFKLTDGKD